MRLLRCGLGRATAALDHKRVVTLAKCPLAARSGSASPCHCLLLTSEQLHRLLRLAQREALVAARLDNMTLELVPSRTAHFALQQWLVIHGDPRQWLVIHGTGMALQPCVNLVLPHTKCDGTRGF